MSNFSSTYPSVSPTYQIDFANGKRIPPNATFSRSDSPIDATKAAASAVHYWSNEKHLSSQNLLLQSSDFNTTWSANDVTRTSTASAGPDSSSAAFLVYPNTNSSNARVYQSLTVSSGERGVLSVYAKQAGKTILAIVEQIGTGSLQYSYFDLTDGSDSGSSNHARTATASGNGYYRCSIALTPNASRSGNVYFYVVDAAGSVTATANGTDGIYLFGSQYETLASGGPTALNATTTQIARSYAPTLKSVATAGQPRFEYDPTDGQSAGTSLGCLIEGQATNLYPYAENGYNGSSAFTYNNNDVVLTENAGIAPSGQLKATLMTEEDASTGQKRISRGFTTTAANYTISVYAKPVGGLDHIGLRIITGGTTYGSFFSTSDGSTSNYGAAPVSSTAEDVGNGWWRLSITATCAAGTSTGYFNCNHGKAGDYTGNGYRGFMFYGLQAELGSHASSWVDTGTSGSTATRAADSLSVATADIGYTGGPVALFAESSTQSPSENPNNRAVVDLSEATASNNRVMIYNLSGQAGGLFVNADNSQQAAVAGGVTDDSYAKVAVSVDTNSIKHCVNGGTVTTDTSAVIPEGMTKLFIGQTRGGEGFGGHIKRVAIYPALSDTNLQALTS